jgi:hypothetical protein
MIRLERMRLQTSSIEDKEVAKNVQGVLGSVDALPETTQFGKFYEFRMMRFNSEYTLIEFDEQLELLTQTVDLAVAKGFNWVSVDVEHSKHHSYFGIVCLIQITIYDGAYRTFLVDTLSLSRNLLKQHVG